MQKTIGIIGLGIMGGAFAKNLVAAGWQVIGYDIDAARCAEAKAAGVEIAAARGDGRRSPSDIITSLPNAPRRARRRPRRSPRAGSQAHVVIEASTLSLDDKIGLRGASWRGRPHVLDCPMSRHRRAGADERPRGLCQRRRRRRSSASSRLFAGFARKVARSRRLRQRQQDEVRRQPAGRDPQRRHRRGDGARHEGRARPEQIVELIAAGAGTSRVFELRAPMMAENTLRRRHHAGLHLAEGHGVIGGFAASLGCPAPLFTLSATLCDAVLASGRGAEDTAAICAVLENMASVPQDIEGVAANRLA